MRLCLDELVFKDINGREIRGKVYCKEEHGHKGFHMYQAKADGVRFVVLWEHETDGRV